MEEARDAVLDISITVMEQVFEEFDEAEEDRQHELLVLGDKVLQLVTIMEPFITAEGLHIITPIYSRNC